MIRVVVISNDRTVQQRLAAQMDIQLTVIEATSMDEAVQLTKECYPDIIVSEKNMENVDADILCHFLSKNCPSAQNIILVEEQPTFDMLQSSGFNVRGYLTSEQKHLIVKAVRVVHDGEAWLPRRLVAEMLNYFASHHVEKVNNDEPKLKLMS